MKLIFTLIFFCFSMVCSGQVQQLKNLLQPDANSSTAGSYPFNFYSQNDKLFFSWQGVFIANVRATGVPQIWWHDPSATLTQTVSLDKSPKPIRPLPSIPSPLKDPTMLHST